MMKRWIAGALFLLFVQANSGTADLLIVVANVVHAKCVCRRTCAMVLPVLPVQATAQNVADAVGCPRAIDSKSFSFSTPSRS